MTRLPDAHGRSVRLNLVDIPPFDPHRLPLHDGLLNDRRLLNDYRLLLHYDRLLHDRRRRHDRGSRFYNHRL